MWPWSYRGTPGEIYYWGMSGRCLLLFFFFSKLSHKADWIFLLSTSMCTKCNPGVVGIKHELTYTSYSLNGYSEEEYELGWKNPLRADSVPPAIVNSKVAWNKEKAWWLIAVSLCSKEPQLMVLPKVPGGSVINHNNLKCNHWEENGKTNCNWFIQQDIIKQYKWMNYSNMQQLKWILVI